MYDFDDWDDYDDDDYVSPAYGKRNYELPTCRDCEETCYWHESRNGWELYDLSTDEPHVCDEEARHSLIADEFEEIE